MTAFIKFKPCDIVTIDYITHPAQSGISITQMGNDYFSPQYYLDTDAFFTPGERRTVFNGDGAFRTGSYNLSGTITLMTHLVLDGDFPKDKNTVNQLRKIYATNNFVRPQSYNSSSVFSSSTASGQYMNLLHIPSILYGSEIKPGSFKWEVGSTDLTLLDDGYGGILSESVLIGSIYYQHGLVYLGHQSETFESAFNPSTIHFSGTNKIPMTMYICTAPKGMLNFSNNSSFTVTNTGSNKEEITTKEPQTFITTIGLYDEDYELLGIAKVAKPILNKEETSIQFRLKLNY